MGRSRVVGLAFKQIIISLLNGMNLLARKESKNSPNYKVLVVFDSPPPFGGVRVSANKIFTSLSRLNGVDYKRTTFDSGDGNILQIVSVFIRNAAANRNVLFQIGDILTLVRPRGIIFCIAARLVGCKIIYKGFAGGLKKAYLNENWKKRLLIRRLLSMCIKVTFQTREDYQFFRSILSKTHSTEIHWLPNFRKIHPGTIEPRKQASKFCFIGKVYKPKGAHLLIEIANQLPANVIIDIYGPITDAEAEDIKISNLSNQSAIRYRGVIEPADVPNVLKDYDALLLPTTWKSEGHPGVILEAFSVGVPVIATRWNGIPDLVDDSCGILISPNSAEELLKAINEMHNDSERWKALRQGALERIKQFDSDIWTAQLHNWIMEVAR